MINNEKLAVFLDVDGVLNTLGTVESTPRGRIGIVDERVGILAKAIKAYGGASIVLTSDWKDLNINDPDYIYLVNKLAGSNLEVAGKIEEHYRHRGEGILKYLEEHKEIQEYVIIDDNEFDFEDYSGIWERLLITRGSDSNSKGGIENVRFASRTPAIEAIVFLELIQENS